MCGIVGVISGGTQSPFDGSDFVAMRDKMSKRGPDDAGVFYENNIRLGHRRLSIRDTQSGRQPWITRDGRFAIVYNGEIYNDREIADELSVLGFRRRTKCDTEVLAEAWSAWGEASVQKFRGMFALGVVERRSGHVWLVRDRLGMKPLYYAEIAGSFVFASTIAAIRRHPEFRSEPNFLAISHYLSTLRSTLGSQTVFKNLYAVRPAEMIRFVDGKIHSSIYWQLPPEKDTEGIEFEDASIELERTIDESVELHLRSDVQIGSMISGGVDSCTLASITRKKLRNSFTGVCGGGVIDAKAESDPQSDFAYARDCANEIDIDYDEVRLTSDDYLESWLALLESSETPLTTPTDAVIYRVAERLRKSCGVAIGGEGADEAFCGYAIQHWSGNDFDRLKSLDLLDSGQCQRFLKSMVEQYGRTEFRSIADHYLSANSVIPLGVQKQLFHPNLISDETERIVEGHYQAMFEELEGVTAAQQYSRVLTKANLESLLLRLDNATMSAGLEARVPFADHVVLEQASKIPHGFKIDLSPHEREPWLSSLALSSRGSLRSKRVFRSVASRWMPDRFSNRPKRSFPTPLVQWLNDDWNQWIAERLVTSKFANQLFRRDVLVELGNVPPQMALWKWPIVNIVLWGDAVFGN